MTTEEAAEKPGYGASPSAVSEVTFAARGCQPGRQSVLKEAICAPLGPAQAVTVGDVGTLDADRWMAGVRSSRLAVRNQTA